MKSVVLISLYGVENNGVRVISSVLRQAGIPVYLVFFKRWVNNDIQMPAHEEYELLLSLLKDLEVGIVGISFTSPFLAVAREISVRIKQRLSVSVVWGGIHASVAPEECLNDCDFVCRGEGEYAMLDLVKALEQGTSLSEIENIGYKENGRVLIKPLRPLIQDLDALPFQDYGGANKFFIQNKLEHRDPLESSSELRIFASRGCPFKCSYCYNNILRAFYEGQIYHRIKKVDTVMGEIAYARSKLKKIKIIKFEDDTFIFPEKWVREFSEKYAKSVALPFDILFNAECPGETMFTELKRAGLRKVQVGLQTGSVIGSARVYERPMSLEKIRRLADLLHQLRLEVVYDVILDNPLIEYADNKALAEFLLTLPRPFCLFMYSLTVFPGTALCEALLQRGLITRDQVEGRATKSFDQFRFSFSYPRSREDAFMASIISLVSKSFVPHFLIRALMGNVFLKRHPEGLIVFAVICNYIKLAGIFVKMLLNGELGGWKIVEYGSPKKALIQ